MHSRELFITNPQEALDLKEKAIRYYRLNINKVIFRNAIKINYYFNI
jgi:hypothetical protein